MRRFPFSCSIPLLLALVILVINSSSDSTIDYDEQTSTESSTEPDEEISLTPSPDDDYTEYWQEEAYDLQTLEEKLGGPLKNRKFVTLEPMPGGKMREIPYKFRTRRHSRPIRSHNESIVDTRFNLTQTNVDTLKQVPHGYNSTTVYIRYLSHKLSALENKGDSLAQLGDTCRATNILEFDYCERAAFPNKGKMVCNTVNDSSRALVPNTCICKYYRVNQKTPRWRQLSSETLNITYFGKVEMRQVCLIPPGGVCNHRISTGMWNKDHRAIYEVDVCRGHFQCDNREPLNGTRLDMHNHCTEKEFLEKFKPEWRDKVMLCSKPHSRKFSDYDEYKYYCLPSHLRELDEGTRNILPVNTKYDAVEVEDDNSVL